MVLCYKYLIMHVHIVQSEIIVRQIPFKGDRSPHTALPHLVEPPSACCTHQGVGFEHNTWRISGLFQDFGDAQRGGSPIGTLEQSEGIEDTLLGFECGRASSDKYDQLSAQCLTCWFRLESPLGRARHMTRGRRQGHREQQHNGELTYQGRGNRTAKELVQLPGEGGGGQQAVACAVLEGFYRYMHEHHCTRAAGQATAANKGVY